MKKNIPISMSPPPPPPPFYCSTVAEGKELDIESTFREINARAFKSPLPVVEKKPAETSTDNKLESKPSTDINESAEAFIKNFRKQLLIQRLESIENYEQMLRRGL